MRHHPAMPGLGSPERRLAEMIRVDHAGEYGAVQIYRGQKAIFDRVAAKSRAAKIIAEMEAGEQEHLKTFDRLLAQRNVRPTLMAPIWRIAGFGLGAATALMGERAAHACTEAVEEVIEEHYGRQSSHLNDDAELKRIVDKFRADEIAHKDKAVAEGARSAPGYGALSAVIKLGCRVAIRVSEKI